MGDSSHREVSVRATDERLDHTGQTFARWTVIERDGDRDKWICVCDCGVRKSVFGGNLRRGLSKSCGCYLAERRIEVKTKHGDARKSGASAEYKTWQGIKRRCFNTHETSYPNYGGRGITMCDRWKNSFEAFRADMGAKPPGTSIDRIDNDGNYEPGTAGGRPQLSRSGIGAPLS